MNTATQNLIEQWRALNPIQPPVRERLWRKFMLDFNYNSNHMEGNTLTYGQTEMLLLFGKVAGEPYMKDLEEMKAHNVVLQMVIEKAGKADEPLTETFIRQIHKILLREDYTIYRRLENGTTSSYSIRAGRYKTRPNSVITNDGKLFKYASVEETPALMFDLLKWYNDVVSNNLLDPLQLATLFHYKYIRIHPFEDGNGRIARLLMNFILYRYGYPMIVIPSNDKVEYLSALNKCDITVGEEPVAGANADINQITPFVEYVEKLLVAEIQTDIAIINGGTMPQWWYNGKLLHFSNPHLLQIADIIVETPKISVRDMAQKVGINPSAVQKHLNTLKDRGCLVRIGGTRGEWHLSMTKL